MRYFPDLLQYPGDLLVFLIGICFKLQGHMKKLDTVMNVH